MRGICGKGYWPLLLRERLPGICADTESTDGIGYRLVATGHRLPAIPTPSVGYPQVSLIGILRPMKPVARDGYDIDVFSFTLSREKKLPGGNSPLSPYSEAII